MVQTSFKPLVAGSIPAGLTHFPPNNALSYMLLIEFGILGATELDLYSIVKVKCNYKLRTQSANVLPLMIGELLITESNDNWIESFL